MTGAWKWAKAHERALWWAFLAASIVVGAIRRPSCSHTPWWAWALPVVLFVGMFAWLHWTTRARPRRRAARTGDLDTYIKTAIRGKRIEYVAWTDTSVVIYTRHGDLVIESNLVYEHEHADDEDHATLCRLDVGSTLSVDLR